jgi:dTDP-4-amino-4,6-dideoxygalactose transaminase
MKQLKDAGIQTSVHYPPVHLFSLYRKKFGYRTGMLPKTEELSGRVVTLPLHPRMKAVDAKRISWRIREIVRRWS